MDKDVAEAGYTFSRVGKKKVQNIQSKFVSIWKKMIFPGRYRYWMLHLQSMSTFVPFIMLAEQVYFCNNDNFHHTCTLVTWCRKIHPFLYLYKSDSHASLCIVWSSIVYFQSTLLLKWSIDFVQQWLRAVCYDLLQTLLTLSSLYFLSHLSPVPLQPMHNHSPTSYLSHLIISTVARTRWRVWKPV